MPNKTDFLVITPLEEEWDAIRRHFPYAKRLPPDENDVRVYFQAEIPVSLPGGDTGTYHVTFVSPLGMGRVEATTTTSDAIHRWQPRYVALVGIAGGVAGRVALGDVLVADQFVDYELQKLREDAQEIRYKLHGADPRLLGAVRYVEGWEARGRIPHPIAGVPRRHIGPVSTGDKVLADGTTIERYRRDWPKLIGVEMEAGGVAASAFQAASKPGVLMVRGVSDLSNADKDSPSVADWREYACDVAAAFLRALLESGPIAFSAITPPATGTRPPPVAPAPSPAAKDPSPKQASELLYEVLRSGSTFDAFCLDCFPVLFRRMGAAMDRDAKHTMLLAEHDPAEVVAALREYDRTRFDRFAPKILSPSAPAPAAEAPRRSTAPGEVVRVSCFFAPADAEFSDELLKQLAPLISNRLISFWSLRDIRPGDRLEEKIDSQLATADVLLFLTSTELFASSERNGWIDRALQRQREQGTLVIPIPVKPVQLAATQLGELVPLPQNGRAVSLSRNRAEAWVAVVEGLLSLLKSGAANSSARD